MPRIEAAPGQEVREVWAYLSPEEARDLHAALGHWLEEAHADPEWHHHVGSPPEGELTIAVVEQAELTWGDTVTVSASAPAEYRPGQVASVCGFDPKEPLVTIEFQDGSDVELPRHLVRKLDE